jgi:hypothetical protein
VEGPGLVDEGELQLVKAEQGVRARLAGEAEGALSVHEGDEGQGGEHSRIHPDAPGFNARPGQGVHQQAAEGVVPHLAQKGGGGPIAAEGGQKIARRPAGVGGQGGIALSIGAELGEVDQQLPHCS